MQCRLCQIAILCTPVAWYSETSEHPIVVLNDCIFSQNVLDRSSVIISISLKKLWVEFDPSDYTYILTSKQNKFGPLVEVGLDCTYNTALLLLRQVLFRFQCLLKFFFRVRVIPIGIELTQSQPVLTVSVSIKAYVFIQWHWHLKWQWVFATWGTH